MEPTPQSNQEFVPDETSLSKEQHRIAFKRGMRWLALGVFLMAMSFVVNFLLFHTEQSFTVAMYLLTSAGLICIMKSMADILGF